MKNDTMFVVDLMLENAEALQNNDFETVSRNCFIIMNYHLDTFRWLCLFGQFYYTATQYNRIFNHHDICFAFRYVKWKMRYSCDDFIDIKPPCIE